MPRLGPALAAGIAFAATAYGCENPPRQEQMVDTRGTTMVVPSNAVVEVRVPREITSCDNVGEYVRERMDSLFWEIAVKFGDSLDSKALGEQVRDRCEEEEMRADCRTVSGHVRKEVDAQMRSMEVRTRSMAFAGARAGKTAEKECLAGYGLAPEEEDEEELVSRTIMMSF